MSIEQAKAAADAETLGSNPNGTELVPAKAQSHIPIISFHRPYAHYVVLQATGLDKTESIRAHVFACFVKKQFLPSQRP